MMTETWLSVLGPFSVRWNGSIVPVRAARHRAVLAVLGARAGQVASFDELAEVVWDSAPPAAARATLRGYVKRLRQALGPELAGRVVTREPGYLLEAAVPEVDLLLFDRLCAHGAAAVQAGEWSSALQLLGQALALWRGEPLADIGCQSLRRDLVPRLVSQRLQAVEGRIDAALALGQHPQLIAELAGLADAHPLRERFCAQLMLALYRCGRQAEALAAYQRTRGVLVDELGVEPGPELRDLQRRILAADPSLCAPAPHARAPDNGSAGSPRVAGSDTVLPRQLPTAVTGFAGRAAELAALDRLAEDDRGVTGAVVIAVIGGTAGVGKTALAVRWAHQVADRFPDGQLYVNLRGFDPSGQAMAPAEAVRGFLDALGMPPERIPQALDVQAALYRSLLAGKQVLVVLDNARDAEQVRPLLPGTATALAIITSRNQLTSLVAAEGAHPLTLDLLTEDEARQLLARRLGGERVAAESDAVDEIIARCARLPLALTIAAARATTRPGLPLAALAAECAGAGTRPDALSIGDAVTQIPAVLSWSYAALFSWSYAALTPPPPVVPAAGATSRAARRRRRSRT
jgi:DNA-binding SARP family transcriptional activator